MTLDDDEMSSPTAAQLRIQKDELDLPSFITLTKDDSLYKFTATISPFEGPYKTGRFRFSIRFKPTYPYDPPKVRCLQRIFHPNINADGSLCLNILRLDWTPVLSLQTVLLGLLSLLLEPSSDEPLNKEAGELLAANRSAFTQTVLMTMRGNEYKTVYYLEIFLAHETHFTLLSWLIWLPGPSLPLVEMYLYHLTIQPPTSISTAINGSFSSPSAQELVLARGVSWIELLRLNPTTGKLSSIWCQNLFCIIRSMTTFRLPGDEKDLLVLGTDSGKLAILEWKEDRWVAVHMETFGRSAVRRTVAGQYVSSDPRGRAIMISAVEKQKLVYLLSRDPSTLKTSISSPLEANKTGVVIFSQTGVDAGYENPMFATLEVDTTPALDNEIVSPSELDKYLAHYEVDVGLNHVVRKFVEKVDRSANLVVGIPGGDDGPGGVLVCSEGKVDWHRMGYESISCPLPKRSDPISVVGKRPVIIINVSMVKSKKGGFFALAQTEEGDLFKVTIDHEQDKVESLSATYYDTVPVASTLQIFRSGFLFVGSEHSSHRLYQIQSLGENAILETSYNLHEESLNLSLVDQLENYGMMTDSKVINSPLSTPFIYSSQGKARHSVLSAMQQGIQITEIANTEMPSEAVGIWTLKDKHGDLDSLIVVSFVDSTVVLQVGETVEEATDTLFLTDIPTIAIGQLHDNSLVQIHSQGVRQIRTDGRICEWKCHDGNRIKCATMNTRQAIIGLDSQVVVYLEVDQSGILLEVGRTQRLNFDILCLSVGSVKGDRIRSRLLAMGSSDMTVRILSCDPDDLLEPLSVQALAAVPSGILIGTDPMDDGLLLHIGLENGVYCKLRLDGTSGTLRDARTRYLGRDAIKITNLGRHNFTVMALANRPWLGFLNNGQYHFCPLVTNKLTSISSFISNQCPTGGLVGICGSSLKIFVIESVSERFMGSRTRLSYTPRKMAYHQPTNLLATVESDHRGYSLKQREVLSPNPDADHLSFDGKWNSCVRLMRGLETVAIHHLTENEAVTWYPIKMECY